MMSTETIKYGEPQYLGKVGVHNDLVVHKERVPRYRVEFVRDADGTLLWHMRGDVKVKEKTRLVPIEPLEREFVEDKLKNNVTQKRYQFREDPEVVAAREAEIAVEQDLRDAAMVAREHGLSLKDVLAKLLGGGAEEAGSDTPKRGRKG